MIASEISLYTSDASDDGQLGGPAYNCCSHFYITIFDGSKDSGKLQTLNILLKLLRAGNHRVLLFAQMTKMFNLLEVTVYRLICKETVEEKILQRASQKNTVQQLVMTGGHVQDDLLKPEDVFSLLLDDAQLEQKLREAPLQVKDRQKKKKQRASKGIRVDADGDVTLEDVNAENEQTRALKESKRAEHDNAKPVNKKRNVKRAKRAKRSITDNIESTVDSTMNYQPSSSYCG